jgi:hypothetical protein
VIRRKDVNSFFRHSQRLHQFLAIDLLITKCPTATGYPYEALAIMLKKSIRNAGIFICSSGLLETKKITCTQRRQTV